MKSAGVKIRLFSVLRERVGQAEIFWSIHEPISVERLLEALGKTYPVIESLRASIRVAVNADYATPDQIVEGGDEVALITPTSGG